MVPLAVLSLCDTNAWQFWASFLCPLVRPWSLTLSYGGKETWIIITSGQCCSGYLCYWCCVHVVALREQTHRPLTTWRWRRTLQANTDHTQRSSQRRQHHTTHVSTRPHVQYDTVWYDNKTSRYEALIRIRYTSGPESDRDFSQPGGPHGALAGIETDDIIPSEWVSEWVGFNVPLNTL